MLKYVIEMKLGIHTSKLGIHTRRWLLIRQILIEIKHIFKINDYIGCFRLIVVVLH